MPISLELLLASMIGVVAGLRSCTAPAVIAWAVYLGWMNLSTSRLSFMGSLWALVFFTICALSEFVVDKLPQTPARTTVVPLLFRIIVGAFTGSAIGIATHTAVYLSAACGSIGAVLGALGGYQARKRLTETSHAPFAIAIAEDLVAIAAGIVVVLNA